MKRFLIATFPGLPAGLLIGLGLALLAIYGCAGTNHNREAAYVLQSKDPCFVIARDPKHVTCLHGARPVDGYPQYRGRLPGN